MASCDWKNGKCKGAGEAKAMLRHSAIEKDRRAIAQKKNKHIDLDKADRNFTLHGLSYEQASRRYDDIIERIKPTNTNHRKDAVTMQFIEIPAPEGLSDEQIEPWFRRVGEIVENDVFGADNFVEGFVHFDEVHEYRDPETKQKVISRVHGHFAGVPVVNGSLNGKKVSLKRNIIKLNNAIEKMTLEDFGCSFNTGKKTKSTKTVETLKNESEITAIEEEAKVKAAQIIEQAQQKSRQMIAEAQQEAEQMMAETEVNFYLERFRGKVKDFPAIRLSPQERVERVRQLPRRLKSISERGHEQFLEDIQRNQDEMEIQM